MEVEWSKQFSDVSLMQSSSKIFHSKNDILCIAVSIGYFQSSAPDIGARLQSSAQMQDSGHYSIQRLYSECVEAVMPCHACVRLSGAK